MNRKMFYNDQYMMNISKIQTFRNEKLQLVYFYNIYLIQNVFLKLSTQLDSM